MLNGFAGSPSDWAIAFDGASESAAADNQTTRVGEATVVTSRERITMVPPSGRWLGGTLGAIGLREGNESIRCGVGIRLREASRTSWRLPAGWGGMVVLRTFDEGYRGGGGWRRRRGAA